MFDNSDGITCFLIYYYEEQALRGKVTSPSHSRAGAWLELRA